MRINLILITVFALCVIAPPQQLPGQEKRTIKNAALPQGPLIRKMADFEAWSIDFYYIGRTEVAPAPSSLETQDTERVETPRDVHDRPTSAVITKTKSRWHSSIRGNQSKHHIEYLGAGNEFFIKRANEDKASRQSLDYSEEEPGEGSYIEDILAHSLMQGHYPGFEWIDTSWYVGVEMIEGKSCLVFERESVTAWVDTEKRQPVLWQSATEIRVFRNLNKPKLLVFPAHVEDILAGLEQDNLRYKFIPPRGG